MGPHVKTVLAKQHQDVTDRVNVDAVQLGEVFGGKSLVPLCQEAALVDHVAFTGRWAKTPFVSYRGTICGRVFNRLSQNFAYSAQDETFGLISTV